MQNSGFNVLWLQGGSCGGCTMAALEHGAGGWFAALKTLGINLVWHPSVSEATAGEATAVFDDILVGRLPLAALPLEGSVLRGPNGSGRFNMLAGTGRSLLAATGPHTQSG